MSTLKPRKRRVPDPPATSAISTAETNMANPNMPNKLVPPPAGPTVPPRTRVTSTSTLVDANILHNSDRDRDKRVRVSKHSAAAAGAYASRSRSAADFRSRARAPEPMAGPVASRSFTRIDPSLMSEFEDEYIGHGSDVGVVNTGTHTGRPRSLVGNRNGTYTW